MKDENFFNPSEKALITVLVNDRCLRFQREYSKELNFYNSCSSEDCKKRSKESQDNINRHIDLCLSVLDKLRNN